MRRSAPAPPYAIAGNGSHAVVDSRERGKRWKKEEKGV
jgi:hypothetical protein